MQICTAISKYHTFDNILKTKNGRAMKLVSIHMFSSYNEHQTNILIFITEPYICKLAPPFLKIKLLPLSRKLKTVEQ